MCHHRTRSGSTIHMYFCFLIYRRYIFSAANDSKRTVMFMDWMTTNPGPLIKELKNPSPPPIQLTIPPVFFKSNVQDSAYPKMQFVSHNKTSLWSKTFWTIVPVAPKKTVPLPSIFWRTRPCNFVWRKFQKRNHNRDKIALYGIGELEQEIFL